MAVKAIVRAKLNRKLQENVEAEISILQSIEHPNVMRLHEVQTTARHVYLILEYCPGGDLMQVIRDKGPQSEAQTRQYLVELSQGSPQALPFTFSQLDEARLSQEQEAPSEEDSSQASEEFD